jgi:DNA-directed RNA polymerase subunit RPC12/RpoP
MAELAPNEQGNVNVTLGVSEAGLKELEGKEFPCPFCGAGLPILASKRQKPYCTCNDCGVQIFVRGKAGLLRLREMARIGILVSGIKESASHGIRLYNRLQQLNLQKRDLEKKQRIFFSDGNIENAISLVDAEIKKVEGELAKIARETKRDIK